MNYRERQKDGSWKIYNQRGDFCLIDSIDLDLIDGIELYVSKYWQMNINSVPVRLHQLIAKRKFGDYVGMVDHKNRDKNDNRRGNLRILTNSLNQANNRNHKNAISIFKGVTKDKRPERGSAPWLSRIVKDKKQYHLGYFSSEIDAARAYDIKAVELFGEYACTNESLGLFDKEEK